MTAVTQIEIRSFMGISEATLSVDDGVTVISGQNGAGKTSAVLALLWAIAGRAGSVDQPVRIGDDEATVRVFAAGEFEYEITRSQKAGGKSSLTVRRDGAPVARPQEVLDALIGTLAFAGMNAKDQVRTLLTAFDADIDLDKLDREHADLEAARRDVGRDRDKAKGHAASIEVPDDTPDTPIDIGALLKELETAEAANRAVDTLERGRADAAVAVDQARNNCARLERELREARSAVEAATAIYAEQRERTDAAVRVDTGPLRDRLACAESLNESVRGSASKREAEQTAARFDADWRRYDKLIKQNRQARADAVAAIGVPIDGFDLTDKGVTVDGVPSSQWSTAQAIRIGAAIFGAGDRDMKVMWVKDGSLCDAASRAEIARIARDTNTQVFIEVVGSEAGAIHFENGQVAS